jgi:hypothetical protein
LSTPEPEFTEEDWMALTDAEIGDFLDHSSQMDIGDWYPGETLASATPSPHMGADLDTDFGAGDWVAGGSASAAAMTTTGHAWTHPTEPHMAFDSGHGLDPQMHAAGYGGYYSQGQQQQQQQPVMAQGYEYDSMLGVYQAQGAAPVAQVSYHQGMYDASCNGGLANQRGDWQGGYSNTGSW